MGLFYSRDLSELDDIKYRLAQLEEKLPIPREVETPDPPSQKVPTWHSELMQKIQSRRESIQPEF